MMKFNQQKYEKLLQEVPIDTLQQEAQLQAFRRYKKQKQRKKRFVQAMLVAACFMLLFIGSIRVFPSFAHAVAQIPSLQPLVKMIALDKGIKDIVLHDYLEEINLSQTIHDKTLTITNVVADEYGMLISYKLQSTTDLFDVKKIQSEVTHNNERIQGSVIADWWMQPKHTYEVENSLQISTYGGLDYSSKDFELMLVVDGSTFKIPFTLKKEIKKSKHYPINQQVTVDGQHFTINELIISPIQSRLTMSVDPSNTKKILSFEDIRFYDEKGEEWGKIRNGFTMHGNIEEQFSMILESSYFRIPKSLVIKFNKIEAIAKEDASIVVDFNQKQILSKSNSLPIELTIKDNYEIEYTIPAYQVDTYKTVFDYFIDAQGDIYYSYSSWLDRQEEYRIGQMFDQNYLDKTPVNPVTLIVSSFEQYLDGTGQIVVELE